MGTDKTSVETILCDAVEIESDANRAAFVERACAGDAALRQEVERLITRHKAAGNFLEDRAGQMTHEAITLPVTGRPGQQIGPYKLRELLGEGGMGSVFVAEQQQPVRRKVAMKLIKLGMDSRQVISRFETERHALALMDHPNIARVLDAGMTDNGRPYFVMEFVRGLPITDHCDQHKLGTRERLELFLQVCRAVQHAHQKGIIHRDLKPGNVLVAMHDTRPVVKVIDFGVAKAIGQSLTDKSIYTGVHDMVGTPLYMSPEQAGHSSLDVDTRSDVYSLGVLLYELLTGCTPFEKATLQQAGYDEMRRIIREVDPPRPSTRCSTLNAASLSTIAQCRQCEPHRLSRQLSGELDWIVMKALEKDRLRRYESASAFAADVERYLSDEPVQACPPTLAYRLQKFTRRNRGLLTTGVLLISILLIATGVSVSYAMQARQASQNANLQRDAAVAAQELSDKWLKQSRIDVDRALKSLDTIVQEVSSAEFSQLPGVDRVRDEILSKALKFYEEIISEHENDPRAREQQALAYANIANISEERGDYDAQLRQINKAVELLEQLVEEQPDKLQFQFSLTSPLFSRQHSPLRTPEEQLADAERCLETLKLCENSEFAADPDELAITYYKVAEKLPTDSPRARQLVETAIQITESRGMPAIPPTQIWLGDRANEAGDLEAAARYYQRGIEMFDIQGADTDRRRVYVERWLSAAETAKLANVYEKLNQTPKAEEAYRRAVTSARQLFTEYHATKIVRDALGQRAIQLTDFLDRQGRNEDAMALLENLLQEFPTYEGLHLAKASRHQRFGRFDLALSACEKAVELDPLNSDAYFCRGTVLSQMGHDEQADENYEQALRLELEKEPLDPGFHYRLQTLAMGNSSVRAKPALAARWALQAEKRLLEDSAGTVTLGIALWMNKQLDLALERFNRAIELDPSSSYAYECRGSVFKDLGRYTDAITDQSMSIELNPRHTWSWYKRGDLSMRHFQRPQEAVADFDMAIQLEPNPHFYKGRANAYLELQQFDKALADLNTLALSKEARQYYEHYQAALLSLKLADLENYTARCLTMVKTATPTDQPNAANLTAWTCALAPNALDDYTDAIALGRAAVEAEPTNPQFLNGLGALLMREGSYAEAKPFLEETVSNPGNEATSKTYSHYFLAMTEHHLNHADAAAAQLKTANELADKELTGPTPWNRKLTIELLRKECDALIGTQKNLNDDETPLSVDDPAPAAAEK